MDWKRANTIKPLRCTCINLYVLRLGNDLLDMISETQATKKK